jgi:cholest-4-en-3-one 26-monooxygenase
MAAPRREPVVVDLDTIDLSDPQLFVDGLPHDLFARLRKDAPLFWQQEGRDAGFWCITRHDDVVAANRDVDRLSAERGVMVFDQPQLARADAPRMMIEMDPPRHTRYRLLVNKGFTPRMIGRLEANMRQVASRIVDRVAEHGQCDFVRDIASELPLQVIAEMMRVPAEDRELLFHWSNRIIGLTEPEYGAGSGDAPAFDAAAQMYAYANQLAAARRAELGSGAEPTAVLDALLTAVVDDGRLSEVEFDLFFLLLIVAGNETTRTAIAQGMLALFEHPEEWGRLRADPTLVASAVDEILRWSTPILHFRRTATEDFELHGNVVHRGDRVVLWFVSANYDDEVFDDPRRFDVGRSPNPHVTFGGGGPHFCLGANLARLEIRVVLEELLARLPDLQLAGTPERLRSNFTNGLKRMPVRFTPTSLAAPTA